jgi:hypothetical protein
VLFPSGAVLIRSQLLGLTWEEMKLIGAAAYNQAAGNAYKTHRRVAEIRGSQGARSLTRSGTSEYDTTHTEHSNSPLGDGDRAKVIVNGGFQVNSRTLRSWYAACDLESCHSSSPLVVP